MASLQDLETALVNADKAGDAASARVLAGEIMKMRAPKKGPLDYVDDVGRSFASGATFGFMDEIAAKGDELIGRGSYAENVARERARDEQIPTAIALPGQIAGAVGTTLLAGPALAATRVVQAIPQLARWAGLGAVEGGLSGAGNAVEGQRGAGAVTGAGVGTVVGAAAPYAVRGAANVAGGIKNAISPGSQRSADLARAIARDADDPASLMARANNASIDRPGQVTLADVGGENVRGLVERIAQTPGAGRTQVIPALTAKQQGQAGRIANDLRSLTGTARTAKQATDEVIADRATAAKPLYDEAFNFNAREVPEIVRAFEEATATGYGKAILNGSNLRKALQTEYGIKDIKDAPLMVLVDAWKKQVDDQIGAAVRGGAGNTSRVLTGMKERVVATVDEFNPVYGSARRAWEGPSKYLDNIEKGRGILSTKVDSEEFAANFAKLSDADKEAQRIGAVSSVVAKMGNDGANLADMTKYLRSPEMRAKVAAIMPDEEAAQAWARRLEFEVESSKLTGRALGNSATARRLAEQEDQKGLMVDLVFDALAQAPVNFVRRVLTAGPKWLRDTARSRSDALMADTLTNPAAINNLPGVLNQVNQLAVPRPRAGANAASIVGGNELLIGQ